MAEGWFHKFFENDYFRKSPEETDNSVEDAIPQVEFLIDVLDLKPDNSILDLCCGYGRHAITFAKRGYNIIGYDLCNRALNMAREKAEKEGLKLPLLRGDMRELPFENGFDVIYNFFTSFGYFEVDSDDIKVLEGVVRALKTQGKFLIDYVNGTRVLEVFKEKFQWEGSEDTYDEETKRLTSKWRFQNEDTGEVSEHLVTQRLYSIDELIDMLDSVGLRTINTYGDIEKNNYDKMSRRMIVVAQKCIRQKYIAVEKVRKIALFACSLQFIKPKSLKKSFFELQHVVS